MARARVILMGVIFVLTGCREPYVVQPIVSHANLTSAWSEFRPKGPLLWSKAVQELIFRIDTPHQIGEHLEVIGPKGKTFVPDVELVADDGKTFVMGTHGFLGGAIFFDSMNEPFKQIIAVRVRSDVPITISNMVWEGYDPKDVKR